MKRNGNIAVNKVYNPKNKKPDMPLDADEVDSAMERYIRKKYQEKSLADGKPQPPQRDDNSPTTYSSRPPLQDPDSPPPPVPSKKGKIFGFGLRASSSAYPFSKSEKKKRSQEPRVDSAFPIPARGYDSRMEDARFDMTDADLQKKLAKLRDMGFTETERNTDLLRRLNGNVERVVETLVRLGPRESAKREQVSRPAPAADSTSRAPGPLYDPFNQPSNQPTVGISLAKPQEPSTPTRTTTYSSNNPYAQPDPTPSGLEQSFQSLQVSQQPQQALFPHSTGGYPSQPAPMQDPRFQYSMTPPVTSTQYQQSFMASPPAMPVTSNPFFQPTSVSAQSTGSNPFMPQQVPSSPSTNPFFSQGPAQSAQMPQRQVSLPANLNPFGIPPSQSLPPQQLAQQPQFQSQDPFGTTPQNQVQPNNPFQQQSFQQQQQQQQQSQPQLTGPQNLQSPSPFPNFQYAQPQGQAQPQPQAQAQMSMPQFQQQQPQLQQQQATYQQPPQQLQAPYQQQPQQQFAQQAQQQLSPQQTGRYDNNSIMALFNYPSLAPQRLATISEPASEQYQQQQQSPPQQISQVPSNPFGNMSPAKRSATMPVSLSHMHSSGGTGNRNPFMTNNNATTQNTNTNLNPFTSSSPFTSPAPQPQNQPQTQYFAQSNPFGQVQEIGHGVVQPQGMPGMSTGFGQSMGQYQQ